MQVYSAAASEETAAAPEEAPSEAAPYESAMDEAVAFDAENKAAGIGDAGPMEPAAANARDALPVPTVTVRGAEILLDAESVTLEELAERLRSSDAGKTGVELILDEAAGETADAVTEMLEELEIPVR